MATRLEKTHESESGSAKSANGAKRQAKTIRRFLPVEEKTRTEQRHQLQESANLLVWLKVLEGDLLVAAAACARKKTPT
jgi:hypothetical protein